MGEAVIFWVCAAGAVVTGAAVFRVDSMARATFALLASFVFAATPLLLLGLSYLGVLVILMMIMEMVVMAVFMIMLMMNPAGHTQKITASPTSHPSAQRAAPDHDDRHHQRLEQRQRDQHHPPELREPVHPHRRHPAAQPHQQPAGRRDVTWGKP